MVTETTIKKGYKPTELGVIPEDWDVKKIGNIGVTYGGLSGKTKNDFAEGEYPYIPFMNIMSNPVIDLHYFDYVNIRSEEKQNKAIKNDLFFNGSSETPEEVGMCSVLQADIPNLYLNSFCFGFRLNKELKTDGLYLSYFFRSPIGRQLIFSLAQGATRYNLSKANFMKLEIPYPDPTEQTAIAAILSDTDALIEHLKKLIAKKKAIKQGVMQQLLTGKKRLPGFSGEWEVKKLGRIVGKITTGKLDANAMTENGEYRFYTCAKDYYLIDQYAFDTEALLVSGNGANVGYIHYYKGKFNAYQRTYVLSDFSENIQFIKLFMDKNLQERIRVEVNAGNTPYITMDTLSDMSIELPPTIEEQTAIAEVLSDMDIEIEKLEQKRDKYTVLKQGMMQQLLTGKIRIYGIE